MEVVNSGVYVYNKGVIGCKRHKKEVMVSVYNKHTITPVFVDIFMSNKEAVKLAVDLVVTIRYNNNGGKKKALRLYKKLLKL